jgi:uncharacterized SAM-dependent methyltransferase
MILEDDRLLIALDITQDATAVENAYLDPTGIVTLLLYDLVCMEALEGHF